MNTRGDATTEEWFLFIEITLGILVASILIYNAANVDSFSVVNKKYAEQDLALLTETILASPGAVEYQYPLKESYSVSIGEKVTVTQSDSPTQAFSYYNLTMTKEQGSKTVTVEKHA